MKTKTKNKIKKRDYCILLNFKKEISLKCKVEVSKKIYKRHQKHKNLSKV